MPSSSICGESTSPTADWRSPGVCTIVWCWRSCVSSASSSPGVAERFERDEPVLIHQGGTPRLVRMADISILGARFIDPAPPPVGTVIKCNVYGQDVSAAVVRRTVGGFGVRFEETVATRVRVVRAFY